MHDINNSGANSQETCKVVAGSPRRAVRFPLFPRFPVVSYGTRDRAYYFAVLLVQIPESLLRFAEQLAAREQITVSQLVASAVSEKICAMSSPEYLAMRAQRGSLDKLREVMSKVPADPRVEGDEL